MGAIKGPKAYRLSLKHLAGWLKRYAARLVTNRNKSKQTRSPLLQRWEPTTARPARDNRIFRKSKPHVF